MSKLGNFVWGIADQLRGVYKPHQYGGVILPFTMLRRLDCILDPTRGEVRALAEKCAGGGETAAARSRMQVARSSGDSARIHGKGRSASRMHLILPRNPYSLKAVRDRPASAMPDPAPHR